MVADHFMLPVSGMRYTGKSRVQGMCERRTKFRFGGTSWGLYRVLGGPIKGYIANLVQGSCGDFVLKAQLLE